MTMWELAACGDGYARAHGGDTKLEAPTTEEFEALKQNAANLAMSKAHP